MAGRMLYLHAMTPIHSGTGQAVEAIDLPIARETVTGWPYLPGSGIKGVLRDACRSASGVAEADWLATFGPETPDADKFAGGLWFADSRLLCFPVRSLAGSFAWLTCPLALQRWSRDHAAAGNQFALSIPTVPPPGQAVQPNQPARPRILLDKSGADKLASGDVVYLEDLDLAADLSAAGAVTALAETIARACFPAAATNPNDPNHAWQALFPGRFGIVDDDLFGFLAETATEVTARVRIEDTRKTVAQGGLWYEEAVPAETIFSAPLMPAPGQDEARCFGVIGAGLTGPLQVGGKASVGRGLVWARLEV